MVRYIWGFGMMSRTARSVALVGAILASSVNAQDTTGASFTFQGQEKSIAQAPRVDGQTVSRFFELGAGCDGLCIAPDTAADGVKTITENAVIAFMTNDVAAGTGLLIDGRDRAARAIGYLPTSANVPQTLVTPDNPLLPEIFAALGARSLLGAYNFSDAMTRVIYDAGPTTMDAHNLINAMIAEGYPAEKIKYYRGGMQVWSTLGLTIEGTSS